MENFNRRNRDLYEIAVKTFNEGNEGSRRMSWQRAVSRAVNSRAPEFYLDREYALRKLSRRRRHSGTGEQPLRRQMWDELQEAVDLRREHHPGEHYWESVDYVLAHHHPSCFFLTERYAFRMIDRIRRKRHICRSAGS